MNDKTLKLLNIFKALFKTSKDQPQNDNEEKWYFVGFFSAFITFFVLGMPLIALSGQLRNVAESSLAWFAIMIGMIVWPLFWLFMLKKLLQFSHNFGLLLFQQYEADKRKKALVHAQPETEAPSQ